MANLDNPVGTTLGASFKEVIVDLGSGYGARQLAVVGVNDATPQPVSVRTVKIAPSPAALVDTNAYAPNDALTGLITLTGAARVNGGSGRIVKCNLFDGAAQANTTFEVFFFDLPGGGGAGQITAVAANAPFAMSDADMAHCLGSVLLPATGTTASDIAATGKLYQNFQTVFPFKCATGDSNLYAQIVLRAGTPTYAAGDIVPTFLIEQD